MPAAKLGSFTHYLSGCHAWKRGHLQPHSSKFSKKLSKILFCSILIQILFNFLRPFGSKRLLRRRALPRKGHSLPTFPRPCKGWGRGVDCLESFLPGHGEAARGERRTAKKYPKQVICRQILERIHRRTAASLPERSLLSLQFSREFNSKLPVYQSHEPSVTRLSQPLSDCKPTPLWF